MLTAGAVIQVLGWLYIGIAAISVGLAIFLANGAKRKASWALLVLGLFLIWPVVSVVQLKQDASTETAKLKAAKERFEMRCKSAGEKISRVVDDVDGILLTRIRPSRPVNAASDSMWEGAALAQESAGDKYILSFLLYEWRGEGYEAQRGNLNSGPTDRPGYRYVDVPDAGLAGRRIRYTVKFDEPSRAGETGLRTFSLQRELVDGPPPQYAVSYEDIVDPEDRKYWIAGTKILVTDLRTGDVLAEQTGFLMDPGQGDSSANRSPWDWAASYGPRCPTVFGGGSHTRFFVDKVLRPKQGGKS